LEWRLSNLQGFVGSGLPQIYQHPNLGGFFLGLYQTAIRWRRPFQKFQTFGKLPASNLQGFIGSGLPQIYQYPNLGGFFVAWAKQHLTVESGHTTDKSHHLPPENDCRP